MSRGRPRHQASRRRMYSPRQRDLRERRIHQHAEEHQVGIELGTSDPDEGPEFESPSWGIHLGAGPSVA